MKYFFTLLALVCMIAAQPVSSQTMSRIIASQTDKHNGSTWVPYDTTLYSFNPGNYTPGDADSMLAGQGTVLKNDGSVLQFYYMGTYYNGYRHSFTYDAQGYMLTHLWEQPTTPMSTTWKNYQKETYSYDANHNITEQLYQNWNSSTSAWDNVSRYVNTYSGNNLATNLSQLWNSINSAWENNNEWTYTYSGGDLITKVFRVYSGSWKNYGRSNFTYYPNKKVQNEIYEMWFDHLGAWRNYSKTSATYNVLDIDSVILGQDWDTVGLAWRNSWRYRYVFNSMNLNIGDTTEGWDIGGSTWQYQSVGTSVNDTSYFRFVWDKPNSIFKNSERGTTSYNSHNQMTLWRTETWDAGTSSWGKNNDASRKYYYNLVSVGVQDIVSVMPVFNVYPTPASSFINLNIQWVKPTEHTIAIFDMQGRVLRQWVEPAANTTTRTIPLADLANGIYTLSVTGSDIRTAKQFVISK